jgi:outer membrane beta-barrel protein
MESRFQYLLLSALLAATAAPAMAAAPADLDLEPLVVREPERRTVKVDAIDTENFEFGLYAGIINVEDFGSNPVQGLRAAYHVTENIFIEGNYGRTTLDRTSFERLSGGAEILSDSQRDMTYYSASVGYNILPGEAFIGRTRAFKGALYALAGVGSTRFAGDERFTLNIGVGYRLIARDWLAFHVTVRNYMFDSDLLGTNETYHNLELTGSLTLFL